jgi:CRP/FNR family transcriptional regulator, cyclic AMP receptor protein
MQTTEIKTGVIIFKEGDLSSEAYRLISGSVEISIFVEGKKVVLANLATGDIFGEMAMIDEHPRSATAITLQDSQVEIMPADDFNQCVMNDPATLRPYLASFFERLRTANNRLKMELRHKAAAAAQQPGPVIERTRIVPFPSPSTGGSAALPRRTDIQHTTPPDLPSDLTVLLKPVNPDVVPQCPAAGVKLHKYPFRIGREESHSLPNVFSANDLVLHDEKPYQVSRNHCSIECEGARLYVRDRGSMVGTIVNGVPIGAGRESLTADLVPGENSIVLGAENSSFGFSVEIR